MNEHSNLARVLVVAVIGLVVGLGIAFVSPWQFAGLAGYDAAAAVFVVWVWISVGRMSPVETQSHATREDPTRVATGILLVSASVASLVGTAFDFIKANNAEGVGRFGLAFVGVLTVAVSWAMVHTVFALRYAHEFYTEPVGGIDFKTDVEAPDYQDFAYVAFTIGMTFQVSDTDIQARRIRRTALRQALLAYLFGAVIVAVVVNVIATLVQH